MLKIIIHRNRQEDRFHRFFAMLTTIALVKIAFNEAERHLNEVADQAKAVS